MLYNEALDGCKRSGDPVSMGVTLFGLAVNYLDQGDNDKGEKYLWDVVRLYEQSFENRLDYRYLRPLRALYKLYENQQRWDDINQLKRNWPGLHLSESPSHSYSAL